jgi:hypothetical protein
VAFLSHHQVAAWTELPLYAGEDGRGLNEVSLGRALAAGLRLRPVGETCVDTAHWAARIPLPPGVGLDPAREAGLLLAWRQRAEAQPPQPGRFRG